MIGRRKDVSVRDGETALEAIARNMVEVLEEYNKETKNAKSSN